MGIGLSAFPEADMFKPTRWLEDRPILHGVFVGLVLCGLLVALLAVSGCTPGGKDQGASEKPSGGPSLDIGGKRACDTFARWLADGSKRSSRLDVTRRVHTDAANSNSGQIDNKAEMLFRLASSRQTANSWTLAADAFAYECQYLGWKP